MGSRDGQTGFSWRQLGDPWVFVATGFGCGFVPVAPGTVGSALGVAIWWFVLSDQDVYTRAAAAFAAFFAGVLIVDRVVKRHRLGDAPAIVLDEIAGVWFALLFVPMSPLWATAAFVLFRIADIAKPWPVSWADTRVKGGLGIMADDLIAGLMASVVVGAAGLAMP
ncbi:MAG: phosphatidylglycerophosphatase A [Gammaproteobacteria bacterium]|nr:phosphatidylglycerophosphatase A [Gammaproteobacteria bacterium]MDE0444853.1 phosphatidylglycerophosphatase A [Gammaproteobacteria bacterium]